MRALRFVHRWLGILLALPLLVQGLSGAILTLEPVLPDWGAWPTASRARAAASPNAMLAAAISAAPTGMRVTRYMPPEDPADPVRVQFAPAGQPRGPGVVIDVDPATATPLGPAAPAGGAMEFIKRLHTTLLVPAWGGRQLAGWMGVGLLALTVLGVPLWWPRGAWREGFTVPRAARGARLQRRLHGAIGIWLWGMLLATSVTGIVAGFPQTSRAVLGVGVGGPPRPAPGAGAGRDGPAALPDLDTATRLALDAVSGTRLRMALLPANGGEPLRLVLAPPGSEGVLQTTMVLLDATGTRLRQVQRPEQASTGETALRMAHDLHFGQGFGPIWRGLTVAAGIALPTLGMTGIATWLLRRATRRRLGRARAHAHGEARASTLVGIDEHA